MDPREVGFPEGELAQDGATSTRRRDEPDVRHSRLKGLADERCLGSAVGRDDDRIRIRSHVVATGLRVESEPGGQLPDGAGDRRFAVDHD